MTQDAAKRAEGAIMTVMGTWIAVYPHIGASVRDAITDVASVIDAAVAEAVTEAVKPYPVAEGDYALMRERVRRAEEAIKERDAKIARLMIIIDGLREGEHEARREERASVEKARLALEAVLDWRRGITRSGGIEIPVWKMVEEAFAALRRPPASAPKDHVQ